MDDLYPALLTTDLHFTSNPRDGYRFAIFDVLKRFKKQYKARTLLILGDLTDAKDNHSAALVNAIVLCLVELDMRIIVLKGNHDYLQKESPFFAFLSQIPQIEFINEPTRIGNWLFLPHSRTVPLPGLELTQERGLTHCFMHQTVTGAISENGQAMDGELDAFTLPHFKSIKFYSGDIHVPQKIGNVEYVGSPYPVHFGDRFNPRFIVLLNERPSSTIDVRWDGLKRWGLTLEAAYHLNDFPIKRGDQVKIKLKLARNEIPHWKKHKQDVVDDCKAKGVDLVSVQLFAHTEPYAVMRPTQPAGISVKPPGILERYAKAGRIDTYLEQVGQQIIKAVR